MSEMNKIETDIINEMVDTFVDEDAPQWIKDAVFEAIRQHYSEENRMNST